MRRRVQFFIGLVLLQLLLLSPAAIWPGYLDSPIGAAIMLFYLLVYLASSLGDSGPACASRALRVGLVSAFNRRVLYCVRLVAGELGHRCSIGEDFPSSPSS